MNARWGDRWRKQQDKNTAVALPEGDEPVTQLVRAGGIKQRWSRWRAILRCVIALAESKGVKNSTAAGWLHRYCAVVSNHEPKHENDRTKGKPLSFLAIERRCGMWVSFAEQAVTCPVPKDRDRHVRAELGRVVEEALTVEWTRSMKGPPIPTSISPVRGPREIVDPNDPVC